MKTLPIFALIFSLALLTGCPLVQPGQPNGLAIAAVDFAQIALRAAEGEIVNRHNTGKLNDAEFTALQSVLGTASSALDKAKADAIAGTPWTSDETDAVAQGFLADLTQYLTDKLLPPLQTVAVPSSGVSIRVGVRPPAK